MVLGGNFTQEIVLKIEVLSSIILTLGLILLAILRKGDFLSNNAREGLKKNYKIFWIATIALLIPLVLFGVIEIIEVVSTAQDLNIESIEKNLNILIFSFLNLGLLLSYYVALRIKGGGK
jgi:hypothetical protein